MNKTFLIKEKFDLLEIDERQRLLLSIAETYPQFKFLRFQRFERFGMFSNTALFSFDGKEFVFVPGNHVTLGWDSFAEGMNKETYDTLKDELSYFDIEDVTSFLKENMSKVRNELIQPMLVECELNEISWEPVSIDNKELFLYKKYIEEFYEKGYNSYTINDRMKIRKVNDSVEAFLYKPCSYEQLLSRVKKQGFSLPNESEWEYLCAGGKRTLFRWGDSFDFSMKLKYFDANRNENSLYVLQELNHFGVQIAFDPYKYEVVDSDECFLKGADGGGSLCGGAGIVLGYLPISSYYQPQECKDDILDYRADIGGDYTSYRRIFTLNGIYMVNYLL